LPWPQEAVHRWHDDAARQEESIPSLAADGAGSMLSMNIARRG